MIDKVFGDNKESSKKLEEELTKLRRENEELRKQAEMVEALRREKTSIQKKYL